MQEVVLCKFVVKFPGCRVRCSLRPVCLRKTKLGALWSEGKNGRAVLCRGAVESVW